MMARKPIQLKPIWRKGYEMRFWIYPKNIHEVHCLCRGVEVVGRTKDEAESLMRAKLRSMKGGK